MAAELTAPHPALGQAPAASVPEQSRRRAALTPADRLVQQLRGIDAFAAARRGREQALHAAGLSREERFSLAREVEVLRRSDDAVKRRCTRGLDADPEPMHWPGVTAVVAHRNAWFVDKLALLLGGHGVTVLVCTDNGAEALGAVVADQPDIVLVGDRLAMMPGRELLAQARVYAPCALLAAQASDQEQAEADRAAADMVFLRHHPPAFVVDALLALHDLTTPGVTGRA